MPRFDLRSFHSACIICACIVASPLVLCFSARAQTPAWKIADVPHVAPVWSGHPVRFALLTHGNRQFVAFYAAAKHAKTLQVSDGVTPQARSS